MNNLGKNPPHQTVFALQARKIKAKQNSGTDSRDWFNSIRLQMRL